MSLVISAKGKIVDQLMAPSAFVPAPSIGTSKSMLEFTLGSWDNCGLDAESLQTALSSSLVTDDATM